MAQSSYETLETVSGKWQKQYNAAKEAFQFGDYDASADLLGRIVKANPRFIDAHILLSRVYYNARQYGLSIESLDHALALDSMYDPQMLFAAAVVYANLNDFNNAISALKSYARSGLPPEKASEIQQLMKTYAIRDSMVNNPVPIDPRALGTEINSSADEALPAFTIDGKRMLFTRRERGQEDLYSAAWDSAAGRWTNVEPFSGVNTEANESAPAISADGSVIAFTVCGKRGVLGRCDIYVARRNTNGSWSPAQNAPELNSPAWDAQPALTADGRGLYFASDRAGSIGGRDIWYSAWLDGRWSNPINCGPMINTEGNEESPFLHFDDRSLYFMSDSRPGMGDYDVFVTRKAGDGWTEPQNLGYPINTTAREGGLSVHPDGTSAYFTREADIGGTMDLFVFELPAALRPGRVSYIEGVVTDKMTGDRINAAIVVYPKDEKSGDGHMYFTDRNGTFSAALSHGKEYGFNVSSKGYSIYSDHFALDSLEPYSSYQLNIALTPLREADPIAAEAPMVLNNIEFAYGDSTLLPSAIPELTLLKRVLTENPGSTARISGHTDSSGDDSFNQTLSEARARAVKAWLAEHGISESRLTTAGYGESKPLADNETEEGRRKNRRTEVDIEFKE